MQNIREVITIYKTNKENNMFSVVTRTCFIYRPFYLYVIMIGDLQSVWQEQMNAAILPFFLFPLFLLDEDVRFVWVCKCVRVR